MATIAPKAVKGSDGYENKKEQESPSSSSVFNPRGEIFTKETKGLEEFHQEFKKEEVELLLKMDQDKLLWTPIPILFDPTHVIKVQDQFFSDVWEGHWKNPLSHPNLEQLKQDSTPQMKFDFGNNFSRQTYSNAVFHDSAIDSAPVDIDINLPSSVETLDEETHIANDSNDESKSLENDVILNNNQSPPLGPFGPHMKIPVLIDSLVTYTTEPVQYILRECSFVIRLESPTYPGEEFRFHNLTTGFYSRYRPFQAVYTDPAGHEHSAHIKAIPVVRNAVFGFFYPTLPGVYIISVYKNDETYANSNSYCNGGWVSPPNGVIGHRQHKRSHIQGSPFPIRVTRNYYLEPKRILIRIGVFGLRDSGVNRGRCWGITSDHITNHLFVSNREQHNILVFNIFGNLLYKFGQDGHEANLFRPTGITCDTYNRRILVADKDNHRIAIFTLDGRYISSFGHCGMGDGEFNYPWGVHVTSSGDKIVVSDSKNHRIQLFDRHGNFLKKFGMLEPTNQSNCENAQCILDSPRGVSFDLNEEHIYVTDHILEKITRINLDFTEASMLTNAELEFGRIQGIAVDNVGNILICDTRRNLIRVLDPNGSLITSIGALENISLHNPLDLTVMKGGEVAVMDYDGRIRIF